MLEGTVDRYARQAAIGGWDQARLTAATVAIAGSGITAFLAALMATAMGFGRIVLIGEPRTPKRAAAQGLWALVGSDKKTWAQFLHRVNPVVQVFGLSRALSPGLLARLPGLAGLITAGNDPSLLAATCGVARQVRLPVVAGCAAGDVGLWGTPRPDKVTAGVARCAESPLVGQMVAALLVEEVRKHLLPLPGEVGPASERQVFALSRLPGTRQMAGSRHGLPACERLAVVGAGALGTWFGLGLGLTGPGCRLDLFDPDVVEETNLNRQVLFFDALGRPKAPVLARRLRELFPAMKVNGYGLAVDRDTAHMLSGALLVACPDSFRVRAFLNEAARSWRQVLLNGGTWALGGSCQAYAPGTTPCLGCQVDVERLAAQEVLPEGCARRAEASVVTSNAVTGALMAWMWSEMRCGRTRPGVWEYDGRSPGRLGVHSVRPACRCHQG